MARARRGHDALRAPGLRVVRELREQHLERNKCRGAERPVWTGRAELRALKEGLLAKCRFRRNWCRFRMRPGSVGMRPDTSGCAGILNSGKFRRILAKFRQNVGKIIANV